MSGPPEPIARDIPHDQARDLVRQVDQRLAVRADAAFVTYTAGCGECGGRGGHEVRDRRSPDGWEDCPHCRRYDDCALCGAVIDCADREPERLLVDGTPQPVCTDCFAMEPDDLRNA